MSAATTMQVRADQVRPGDVLRVPGFGPLEVRQVQIGIDSSRTFEVGIAGAPSSVLNTYRPGDMVAIEACSRRLTPAQQHAEELLELVRDMAKGNSYPSDAAELLAKIEPPVAPTPEELAALLAEIRSEASAVIGIGIERGQRLDAALQRARAAKLIP